MWASELVWMLYRGKETENSPLLAYYWARFDNSGQVIGPIFMGEWSTKKASYCTTASFFRNVGKVLPLLAAL